MSLLVDNTPVEMHHGIFVKREDLCCPYPGPSFSKMRGVVAHMQNRPESVIGVLDTFHSKAGWAVAWSGRELGKQVVDFWPRYKADGDTPLPRYQQQQAQALGAIPVELKAGRSAILFHQAKKHMLANYPGSYVMPNALKLPESITENAAEAVRTIQSGAIHNYGTLVLSISSGTVASGVIKGFRDAGVLNRFDVVLHMGYSRSQAAVAKYMSGMAGFDIAENCRSLRMVDEGYDYADKVPNGAIPFPCNPHYDAKAWQWLENNREQLRPNSPTLMWNIGE